MAAVAACVCCALMLMLMLMLRGGVCGDCLGRKGEGQERGFACVASQHSWAGTLADHQSPHCTQAGDHGLCSCCLCLWMVDSLFCAMQQKHFSLPVVTFTLPGPLGDLPRPTAPDIFCSTNTVTLCSLRRLLMFV